MIALLTPYVALLKFMDCILNFQIRIYLHTYKRFMAILFTLRVFRQEREGEKVAEEIFRFVGDVWLGV